MADKPQTQDPKTSSSKEPLSAMAQLQEAGFGNMMGMSSAWMEALSDMSAEVVGFVADRIKEDVKTQHEILHCKNVADLSHIQATFMQKAMDQYQAESGKLVEMTTKAFEPKGKKDKG
ncbi:MAG: phasin family protein [Sulfitobacter sp.]